MKIAVLMLCHEPPATLAAQWRWPLYRDPAVKLYIHYDAARSQAEFDALRGSLPADISAELLPDRVRCAWGEYSLVEATRRLLARATADDAFGADYLLLISGSCVPIRPLSSLREFLRRRRGMDFIQATDIAVERWVRDGLEEERFRFHFPFNYQTQRRRFDFAVALQRRLGVWRVEPDGLRVHFGSQWFCLTRESAVSVVESLERPAWVDFFRRSWIPDEFAIQTLVASRRPAAFIARHNLTYAEFDEQGRPLVLEDGHFDHLMRQPFFFARKVAPEAQRLLAQLHAHVDQDEVDLSYFERAGTPDGRYQRFLARALHDPQARGRLGTTEEDWRGLMERNGKPYYVLCSHSAGYLRALLSAARGASGLPLFDEVFAPGAAAPASEVAAYLGVQPSIANRRDYDPASVLLELVHLDDAAPTAFAFDAAQEHWLRTQVQWDRAATVLLCDPPGLSYAQRAASALRAPATGRRFELEVRLSEAVAGRKWLPAEFFHQAQSEQKHHCRILSLHEQRAPADDATLAALIAASAQVDPAPHYPDETAALRLLRGRPEGD